MGKKTTKTDYYYSSLYKGNESPATITMHTQSANHKISQIAVTMHDFSDSAHEHYGCDVYSNIIIDQQEQLQKLAGKFQARTAKELLDRITQRFSAYNSQAYTEFALFLIKKQIDFRSLTN